MCGHDMFINVRWGRGERGGTLIHLRDELVYLYSITTAAMDQMDRSMAEDGVMLK